MANITVDIKKKSIEIGSNLVAIGKWWMNPWVYDPQEIKADAFDMDNMVDWIDKHYLTTEQIEEFEGKQDALTAWDNIDITNNVISATDTTYTAWEWISIDENNVISNTQTSAEWWNIQWDIEDQEDLQLALWEKQDVLTAGENVQIENNVISATDTTYTAWQWISIDENNVISNTQTSAEWWNIQGDIEDQTDLQSALDDKQDVISDLSEIRSNATAGKDASDTIATYWDIVTHDADEFATADSVGEWVLTIQKNSTTVDTFSANAKTDKTINITVPTQASDIGALPDTTKYAANLDLSINSSTYVITAQLKDQDWNNLWTQRTIDLPLESVVVDWEYDAENKKIILTLENGNKIEFSVADLVSWLQTEITVDNKLDADLVDDATASHKFVTSTEKSCISTAVQPWDLATYAKCCDIPTDNCQLANGCGYTTCTWTLVPSDIEDLAKCCDIPTDNCQLTNGCWYIKWINCSDVTTALWYTPYSNTNPAWYTTCTGTLVPSDIENLAQCCDIPTDNCQLANGCGFTTCTWTLVASDIENLAQCCDIPTDNCQLANSCGYTTCTWTLVASDIENLAQCCDIPTDNCQLSNSCWYTTCTGTLVESDLCWYQKTCNMVCDLTDADNSHYPTAKAVSDAISWGWFWDMLKSVYDPCWCEGDAFNACNMYNMPHIPTDNCELSNSCGFTTCTWTLVESDLACYAKCADIPTNNCQLTNGCGYIKWINCSDVTTALGFTPYNSTNPAGYTTCTGTLVASDIENLAQCCDIPTDNCQLSNGCGYTTCTWTVVASDLQPYAKTCDLATVATSWKYCDLSWQPTIPTDNCQLANSCWYTTCTWTLVASDIQNLAQCCDIPTDNCQLGNSCGFTTCTGTLNWWDLKTVNGCCLVWSGDICIQGWGIENDTTWTTDTIEAFWSWTKAEFNCLTRDPDKYYIVTDAGSTDWVVCDTAFGCSWDTVTDKAPSMNAVYDAMCCCIQFPVTSVNWCTWAVTVDEFSPSNSWTEWQVLTKTNAWYNWSEAPATWIQNLPWSPVCICYKWTWDMCAYCALGTYRTDTEYNVYE